MAHIWIISVGLGFVVARMQGQGIGNLLLPESRHIMGVVIDEEGNPIAEARIDHANDRLKAHRTDSEGRFELDTRAPAFIVRKAGFRSELVRTQEVTSLRITLQKIERNRSFPTCSNTGQYLGIDGWGASFQFLKVAGIKASAQGHDIDYGNRSYYVDTEGGPRGIRHGSGPMWSFGIPIDQDVWRSVKYDEVTFAVGRLTIIDARGQFADATRWRELGKFGESASYSGVDEAIAKILDQFLDGACLKPVPKP
jgi:hypothetical protein